MTTELLAQRVADTTSRRDRDELDLSIARLLQQFLGAHSVALFRLVNDGGVIRIGKRAAVAQGSEESGPDRVTELSQLPLLADLPAWQECASKNEMIQSTGSDGRLTALFPLLGERGEVNGVLAVDAVQALATRDADLVRGILQILQNHLALLEYGERDTLTSLLNRKTFEGKFHKLHERRPQIKKNGEPAVQEPSWLALIDIDKFKAINDNFGHLFGDEVLLLTSQLMMRNFRGADQLFRFGGEEFVVVLDQATEAGARIALERLRVAMEAFEFPQVGTVTISIGYTQVKPQDMSTICIERADAALYYVKSHGRNGLRSYEALVASGDLVAKVDESDIDLF